MVDGKTAYARGSKITGSVHEMDRFIYVSYESMENARHLEEIRIKSTNTWGDQLVRVGAYVMNDIPYEQYKKYGPFKMFNSLQEMNGATDKGNGDVALVYSMENEQIDRTTTFNIIHFNKYSYITKNQADIILDGDDDNYKTFTFSSGNGDYVSIEVNVTKYEQDYEEDMSIEYEIIVHISIGRNDNYTYELSYSGSIDSLSLVDDYFYFIFNNDLHYTGSVSEWETFGSFLSSIFNKVNMYYTGVYVYDGNKWIQAPNTPDGEEKQQALDLIAEINGEIV